MPLMLLWHPRAIVAVEEAQEVYIDIQVISDESFSYGDSATVYIDIQPGFLFTEVDYLLEIVGMTSRWQTSVAELRWGLSEATSRWTSAEMFARWVLMETKRFFWRG